MRRVAPDTAPAKILEVTSYPPPRAGWGIRVEYLKKQLEAEGHRCVVLNIGSSRHIPSTEYETVMSGWDFVRKVWRFSREGYVVHAHANGDSPKGMTLALLSSFIGLLLGRRPYLTFHAGAIQRYFPKDRSGMWTPLFRLLFAMPKRIICNSEAVKACIVGYGVPADKVVPIAAFSRQYLEFQPQPLPEALESLYSRFPTVVFAYVRMRKLFFPTTLAEGMALVLHRRHDVGLAIVGGTSHPDPGVREEFLAALERGGVQDRICLIEDLDHDAFLTALQKSALYLRTHLADGVASSIMESLALGVPVVACENGTRPPAVVTFPPTDAGALAAAVEHVLDQRESVVRGISDADVPDTLNDEVALLTCS